VKSFYRTYEELKPEGINKDFKSSLSFYRTYEELKHFDVIDPYVPFVKVFIVPMRN